MDKLVSAKGQPTFGFFDEPVGEINGQDYHLLSAMGRRKGLLARWAGFKRFQYFGIISEDLIVGCAIADVRLAALAFVYCYDPKTNQRVEKSFLRPLGLGVNMNQTPSQGQSRCQKFSGTGGLTLAYQGDEKILSVDLGKQFQIQATFTDPKPLAICTKAGRRGWVYAQKSAGCAVTGTAKSKLGEFDLTEIGAHGHHDFSAGFMRRETYWNWACLAGALADGRRIGLNLSCGVNETSYTENCWWLDGELQKVDLVQFDFDANDHERPWHITSSCGRVDLTVQPLGHHSERINALIMASDFKQFYGRFSGSLTTENGHTIQLNRQLGFVEDHYAKW